MPISIRPAPPHVPKLDPEHPSREVNAPAIQNLEAKIQHAGDTIHLKRLRNSLLNVSIFLPPEILAHIFWWTVVSGLNPSGRISGGTFSFLLVCRYWFDVATSTPSLWAFWGPSLRQCRVFHPYSGAVPLHLNLTNVSSDREVKSPSCVLRDWNVQRRIRHLDIHTTPRILAEILSLMSTPQPSSVRSQIQSLTLAVEGLWDPGHPGEFPDITDFLGARFPSELRILHIRGCALGWESLILCTSKLTHLFIHAPNGSTKPTVLQLAALFAGNSALEEIDLSLEIISTPEGSLSRTPTSIFLPHLRRLTVRGSVTGHTRLLNRLTFSDALKQVNTDLFLDGIMMDVPAALAPFLQNLFLACQPSQLAIHILYASAGLDINLSRPGERGDPEDFLMLKMSSRDVPLWDLVSSLPEEVVSRLPTTSITSLRIRRHSSVYRQDFRRLFRMLSSVQELRITHSDIHDIVQVLASPSPTGEDDEPALLPRLHTFQLREIDFTSSLHSDTATHLGHFLEQRCRDGLPLGRLSMVYCPHISLDACSGFAGSLSDHFCWDRHEAASARQLVCETCHTGWGDLD